MQIANVNQEGNKIPVMVFTREVNGKTFYSLGLSKKKVDGTYESGYILAEFNKDVKLANKSKILINSAILEFYKKDSQTIPYVRVFNFTKVEETNSTITGQAEIPLY